MAIDTPTRSVASRARVWSVQTDAMLCRAVRRGSEPALEELYRRHHRQLSAFVFHLLGGGHHRENTEEVVQDAFTRAFASVRERDFEGSFKQWLFVIARNRAIDLMRGERADLVPLESDEPAAAPRAPAADEPSVAAEAHAELEWLVSAISNLPERQRSALLLRELGGLSYGSIARAMQTSPGSVRQLISRGRDGVRRAAAADSAAPGSLRRGLLDAAPVLPIGAFGAGAVAVTGVGAGGAVVTAKLAAVLASVLLFAGAVGTVEQLDDARADESAGARPAAAPAQDGARERAVVAKERGQGAPTNRRGESELAKLDKPAPGGAVPSPGRAAPAETKSADADALQPAAKPETPDESPLQPVADLPGEVVGNVDGALSGEKPLGEAVGDTVEAVVDTVGKTVGGVTESLTKR